ncbi:hypothetical protein ACI2OX_05260 [Bacillus sp. N9]
MQWEENQTLKDGEVAIDSAGNLTFGTQLAKDSVVKVDYVLENKTANFTHPADAETPLTTWNVEATGLASATIEINGETFEINNANEDGDAQIGAYGTINLKTGTITFEPERTEETNIKVTYTQNYSAFNMNTHTSKGEQNEQFLLPIMIR